MVRLLCLGSLLVAVAAATAQAPPGFKTYENKHQKVTFHYPTVYSEVPLPPTELVLVARFVMKSVPPELKRVDERIVNAVEPQIQVFAFDMPAATTGTPSDAAKPASGPTTVREAMEAQSRVTSWAEFVSRFAAWDLKPDVKDPDHFVMNYKGQSPSPTMSVTGHMLRKQIGSTVVGAFGYTLDAHSDTMLKQLVKVQKSLALAEPDTTGDMEAAAIDRLYASGKYRGVEGRKKARLEMSAGWRAIDTENYLIVHHSKNDGLIRRIARDIEAMRAVYTELFPPSAPMDQVSIVRVCRTMEEYFQYGGPRNSGGFWHSGNEELVFYDYSYTMKVMDDDQKKSMGGRKLTNDDSLLVLYHEAFHQYIHYAIGEFSPHDWFNEGYGDFFSGAVVSDSGKVVRIDPSPWRIHLAKDMCEYGKGFVPLQEILGAERAVFYHPARIGFFYAGAWSFLFFLKNAKEVAAHPVWSKLLDTYLTAIKASYGEEIKKVGEAPDLAQKQVAAFAARRVALAKMLEGVDVKELETAWKRYVIDMKDPWPSLRKKPK
ncbi:MAG: hypothetical protein K8J09_18490 [Planctomycetes bacterium]|nr:hypothetical protein [Planctomycetota bacterium]MCC7397103.1 hypothetical protein [Planctomycetota bacterium]